MAMKQQVDAESEKQQALALVRSLPDDVTGDDILYALDVLRRGAPEAENGHPVGKLEAVRRLKWRLQVTGRA